MSENTNVDMPEAVTEVAPKQYTGAKRGRKPGQKNGEGKSPKPAAHKLTAESVRVVNDVLMIAIQNGPTLRYNGDQRPEADYGKSVFSEADASRLAECLKVAPDCPKNPSEVVQFGRALGFGIEGFDSLTVIRQWVVK